MEPGRDTRSLLVSSQFLILLFGPGVFMGVIIFVDIAI